MKRILLILAIVLPALSCASVKASEAKVEKFHQRFNDKQFVQIYADSGEEFKKEHTEQETIERLEKIFENLGAEKSTHETSWKVANGWTFLDYDTEFERGKRHERFVFSTQNEKTVLSAYIVKEN